MSLSNKYDSNIYVEPDGSSWVRIFHHNNPATYGIFAHHSDSEWNAGVYGTENKWFDMDILNNISTTWELMVKQKTTSDATETKWRWTQAYNPLTTTAWTTAQPGTVTFNTSSGYSTSSYGGLWKMNSSSRMNIANTTSSNWFGAIGSWTVYNNGFPGYPNTTVTTGYLDVYVRVDSLLETSSERGLQVWLPLTGSLENKGLNQTVGVSNAGAVADSSGKLGACYKFGTGTSKVIVDAKAMTDFTTEASVCFWIKINSWNTAWATYFQAGIGTSPWASYIMGFLRNNTNSTCCFTISSASTSSQANYLTPALTLGQWYHIGLVYKTGHAIIYVDGVQTSDNTTSIVPNFAGISVITLGNVNANSYQSDCYMNDFRIYNQALSAKEVKEISKGLLLHYKLDEAGYAEGTTNLITSSDGLSNTCYNGATNKYGYGTSTDMYKTVTTLQGISGTKVYMGTNGLAAYPYVYFDPFDSAGTNVRTLSFDYFPTLQNTLIPYSYNGAYNWKWVVNGVPGSANNASSVTLTGINVNQWNHIEVTAIKYDTSSTSRGVGYIRIGSANHTSNTNNFWFFANVQVESKDHATAYVGGPGITRPEGYQCGSAGVGYGGPNLSSPYVMPGGNQPGNTSTAGRTQYYGNYGIKIPAAENADTYFTIWYNTPLQLNNVYTLSCNASGLLPGALYNFPLFVQGNTGMGLLRIDHNGRCFLTFKMTYTGTITTTTYDGKTLYRLFMDDSGRTIPSGQGNVTLTDFRLEPGIGQEVASKWAYNTQGTIETSADTGRYSASCYVNSSDNTTSTASGTVYLEAPCWLENVTHMTTTFWCKPIAGYGSTTSHGQFCLSYTGTGNDYNSVPMHHRDAGIDMTGTNGTDYRVGINFVANAWHHYAIVYNSNIAYVYQDGVKVGTSGAIVGPLKPCQRLIIGFSYAGGVWRSNKSYYSDFRIYGTALSDADVLELYHTEASIDRDGNYYTRELVE